MEKEGDEIRKEGPRGDWVKGKGERAKKDGGERGRKIRGGNQRWR